MPTLSQIAAEAAFEGRAELEEIKHGYEDNRRLLVEGLPRAGLTSFLYTRWPPVTFRMSVIWQ